MAALSDYLENKLVDHVFRNTTYTPPTTVYVALFTSSASLAQLEAGTLTNEVTAGAYAYERKAITFTAPSNGATSNNAVITWTNMPGVTVAYAAIMDASSAGNVLVYGGLVTPKTINPGDTFAIATGDYTVTLA
jgi:hypothetical protein